MFYNRLHLSVSLPPPSTTLFFALLIIVNLFSIIINLLGKFSCRAALHIHLQAIVVVLSGSVQFC